MIVARAVGIGGRRVGQRAAGADRGLAANRPALVLLVTMKLTVWPASLAGPALMAVAQPVTVCAPASSSTVWFGALW